MRTQSLHIDPVSNKVMQKNQLLNLNPAPSILSSATKLRKNEWEPVDVTHFLLKEEWCLNDDDDDINYVFPVVLYFSASL